ncbi:hypothetical protein [Neptuniibacter sp. CAU 1671]|uniref:hypothetical protein n=1 Tax=Neptuniibacter sp. CAU 1671 TaxID=3032593 RepID=UPI0023DA7BFF|nr:hypothetical protein [Neptuniibacter sp. CAU 1671]MDF2181864.1 hypothetical protein [Neptuniibacter sp. CAU 1671]
MIRLPSENIGSIPRPKYLIEAYNAFNAGNLSAAQLDELAKQASRETIKSLEDLGAEIVTDGEQQKFNSFAGYCTHCAPNIAPDGLRIDFSDGHFRHLPRLTSGPFKYQYTADQFLEYTLQHTASKVKQAVISPSLVSLLYPANGLEGYSRMQFTRDVLEQHTREIQRCLNLGADKVQIDFTEARLSLKIDPSGELLQNMVDLINSVLDTFTDEERSRIGVHTCPGSDLDSAHSADIDYKYLLPKLFTIRAGNFYIAMAGEADPTPALRLIRTCLRPGLRVYIGVINPVDPEIETPELVCERVLEAAKYIPLLQLGICDDCGFSPFADDESTSREVAFGKIKSRILGGKLAEVKLAELVGK